MTVNYACLSYEKLSVGLSEASDRFPSSPQLKGLRSESELHVRGTQQAAKNAGPASAPPTLDGACQIFAGHADGG